MSCRLTSSHRAMFGIKRTQQTHGYTVLHGYSSLRDPAWIPSHCTCWWIESLSRGAFGGVVGSCETRGATLCSRHFLRLVLTPGRRSGIFTYRRTSTSFCGLGRSPNVFPLPSCAAQMFWSISRCYSGSFIYPVVLLVSVWPDGMDLLQILAEIRLPCFKS